jgi:ubiquinone biosynthesis protein UbiJ
MIKKYTLKALQKAINKALALDESFPHKLNHLHGKVIKLIIKPLEVSFFISFKEEELILLDQFEGDVDTTIESSPLGLIKLSFLPASKARSLFNDNIRITGDVELGQKIKQLFDELDIDWESHIAHFTGDVAAYQLGSWFRQGIAFKNQISGSIKHSLTEYLQEELRACPSSEEVDDFFHDLDTLSLDVERLQARLTLLVASHEND